MGNFGTRDYVVLTVFFLAAFWLWTLPLQASPLPFGEHDAAYIFSYGDEMAYKDKSFDLVGDTPLASDFWYAGYNTILGPRGIQYPPPYNLDYAFAQIFGGERFVPVYIFIAVTCFAGVFGVYWLIRKLYGFEAALIASMGALFSFRIMMLYLWGQRHNVAAFTFVPISVYVLYKYLDSFYKKEENIAYLYIFGLLLLGGYLMHLSAAVFLIPYAIIFVSLMSIRHKRLPLSRKNIRHYAILVVILTVVVGQFYLVYFGPKMNRESKLGINDASSLFHWIKVPENNFGMNPAFSQYPPSYIGYWTLVLLFAGIIILLKRRNTKDLAIISGFIGLYLMFHIGTFGLFKPTSYRIGRFLVLETYFFYATMAIALTSIPNFINIPKPQKKFLKAGLTVLFILVIIFTQGAQTYKTLKGAYQPILRITPAQLELSEWVEENIPKESASRLLGTLTYPKKAFIQLLSRRVIDRTNFDSQITRKEIREEDIIKEGMVVPDYLVDGTDFVIPIDYIIFDYSDLVLIGDKNKIEAISSIEKNISNSAELLYNKNNIRVYKFE